MNRPPIELVEDKLRRYDIYDCDGMRCGRIKVKRDALEIRFRDNYLSLEEWDRLDSLVRKVYAANDLD